MDSSTSLPHHGSEEPHDSLVPRPLGAASGPAIIETNPTGLNVTEIARRANSVGSSALFSTSGSGTTGDVALRCQPNLYKKASPVWIGVSILYTLGGAALIATSIVCVILSHGAFSELSGTFMMCGGAMTVEGGILLGTELTSKYILRVLPRDASAKEKAASIAHQFFQVQAREFAAYAPLQIVFYMAYGSVFNNSAAFWNLFRTSPMQMMRNCIIGIALQSTIDSFTQLSGHGLMSWIMGKAAKNVEESLQERGKANPVAQKLCDWFGKDSPSDTAAQKQHRRLATLFLICAVTGGANALTNPLGSLVSQLSSNPLSAFHLKSLKVLWSDGLGSAVLGACMSWVGVFVPDLAMYGLVDRAPEAWKKHRDGTAPNETLAFGSSEQAMQERIPQLRVNEGEASLIQPRKAFLEKEIARLQAISSSSQTSSAHSMLVAQSIAIYEKELYFLELLERNAREGSEPVDINAAVKATSALSYAYLKLAIAEYDLATAASEEDRAAQWELYSQAYGELVGAVANELPIVFREIEKTVPPRTLADRVKPWGETHWAKVATKIESLRAKARTSDETTHIGEELLELSASVDRPFSFSRFAKNLDWKSVGKVAFSIVVGSLLCGVGFLLLSKAGIAQAGLPQPSPQVLLSAFGIYVIASMVVQAGCVGVSFYDFESFKPGRTHHTHRPAARVPTAGDEQVPFVPPPYPSSSSASLDPTSDV